MAELAAGPAQRQALQMRYRLLRNPAGRGVPLTERAGRFAARRQGCSLRLGELAALPLWELDPAIDREQLAAAAGLMASRPALERTIDGTALRRLADAFGATLLEQVLAQGDGPAMVELPVAADRLDPASICELGHAVLQQGADPGQVAARTLCDTALTLIRSGEGGPA